MRGGRAKDGELLKGVGDACPVILLLLCSLHRPSRRQAVKWTRQRVLLLASSLPKVSFLHSSLLPFANGQRLETEWTKAIEVHPPLLHSSHAR
jgi:hypothetical protein